MKVSKRLTDGSETMPCDSDDEKIYRAANEYMTQKGFGPQQKVGTLLDQFAFNEKSPALNRVQPELRMAPPQMVCQHPPGERAESRHRPLHERLLCARQLLS
ncbi:MAG: hypothetical protein AB7S53_07925 [Thiomonas sp.]